MSCVNGVTPPMWSNLVGSFQRTGGGGLVAEETCLEKFTAPSSGAIFPITFKNCGAIFPIHSERGVN